MTSKRMYDDRGYQIIQVSSIPARTSPQRYAYIWGGKSELAIGDQLVLVVDGHDWEVEVVGLGSGYKGPMVTIGGEWGLRYSLNPGAGI